MTNRLTPANIVKAWATLTTTGGGSTTVTVTDGFNIASAACDTDSIGVTLAAAFANTTYAVFASCANLAMVLKCTPATNTGIDISGANLSPGVDLSVNPIAAYNFRDGPSVVIHVMVIGRQ